jgi:hypothetical protein
MSIIVKSVKNYLFIFIMESEQDGVIFFKLRSEKAYEPITFKGDVIQIGMIKKLIDEKRTRVVIKSDCFKR